MKKILLVMDSLGAGGAEKSLITFLNILPQDNYKIELILIRKEGLFLPQIPKHIQLLEKIYPLQFLGVSPTNIIFYIKNGFSFFLKKLYRYQKAKKNKKGLAIPQALWNSWRRDIKDLDREYDVAISYLEGFTNYYVIEKVHAEKKILWIHNEYNKLKYNKDFDYNYFRQADNIVTISDLCKKDLVHNFPDLANKFIVLENISDTNRIKELAKENITDEIFTKSNGVKLLSVGRLSPQKGYDLALKAASILKSKNINFSWFIIGEGALKNDLEELKQKLQLDKNVYFMGLRSNPYKYMQQADIIVQSSSFEGKSIAIDEAKILCKPIVSTNYNTVQDLIQNNINGIITEMNPESLSNGIINIIIDKDLRYKLIDNLRKESNDNTKEIDRYIKLIEN